MFAVTIRGAVVTARNLRAHGWEAALDRDRAVFAAREDAEEFAAWLGRTFREPQDQASVVPARPLT